MKTLLAAVSLLALGVTTASAQYSGWSRGRYPYEERHHAECQHKAQNLHDFQRRAARDGRIDHNEREIIRSLERDLNRTCGGFRWR